MSHGLKKNNHYIPQFIIKNFTNNIGKIYEFKIDKKTWNLPNGAKTDGAMTTFGVGKENSLYIQEDESGKFTDQLENGLAYLESGVSPIIDKIIKHKTKKFFNDIGTILNNDEYSLLLLFLAVGFLRTPNNLNSIAQGMAGIMLELFSIGLKNTEYEDILEHQKTTEYLNEKFVIEVSNQILLYNTFKEENIMEILNLLDKYQWILIDNNTMFDFLLGDSFLNLEKPGLSKKNTIFVPLGNKKALIAINDTYIHVNKLNKIVKTQKKKESLIKEFNFYAIKNSKQSIFSSTKSDSIKKYIIKNIHKNHTFIYSGISGKSYIPSYKRNNVNTKK